MREREGGARLAEAAAEVYLNEKEKMAFPDS